MARKKKQTKQKQKQSQKVVQTVNVVVAAPKKKSSGRRRRRQEPAVETISSKTLAPIFIQPPVASMQYQPTLPSESHTVPQPSSVAQTVPQPVSVTESVSVTQPTPQKAFKKPRIIPVEAEDLRPAAEPLFPEKDTTKIPLTESYGVVFDAAHLKDVDIQAPRSPRLSLSNVDYTPPSFDISPERDIIAVVNKAPEVAAEKPADVTEPKKMTKPRVPKELVSDFKLYAKNVGMRDLPDLAIVNYIYDIMKNEGLKTSEFKKKYLTYPAKAKQVRSKSAAPVVTAQAIYDTDVIASDRSALSGKTLPEGQFSTADITIIRRKKPAPAPAPAPTTKPDINAFFQMVPGQPTIE